VPIPGAAVAKSGIVPLANRHEDIGLPIEISAVVMKARGNDADHGICGAVKVEGFSGKLPGRAEFALPEARAHENNRGGADLVFFRVELATDYRLHAQKREEIGGDHFDSEPFGFAHAGKLEAVLAKCRESGEAAVVANPVEKIGIRDRGGSEFPIARIHRNQAIRLVKRKRAEKNATDDGKKRSIGTDAQSQGQNGDKHKCRSLKQHAEAVANVLRQGVHPFLLFLLQPNQGINAPGAGVRTAGHQKQVHHLIPPAVRSWDRPK
jgi:hypothetical protein